MGYVPQRGGGPARSAGEGLRPSPWGSRAQPRSGEHGAGPHAAGVGPQRLRRWGGGAAPVRMHAVLGLPETAGLDLLGG